MSKNSYLIFFLILKTANTFAFNIRNLHFIHNLERKIVTAHFLFERHRVIIPTFVIADTTFDNTITYSYNKDLPESILEHIIIKIEDYLEQNPYRK